MDIREPQQDIRIAVVGVGGGGTKAVDYMIDWGLRGVEVMAANSDAQSLASSRAKVRIQLGPRLTEGLGSRADPEIGEQAALESQAEIRAALSGVHLCFIAAGMGGGTGTGAAPVIAQIARQVGVLTVAMVTTPFDFEGPRRRRVADAGIERLKEVVDAIIVIPNQNLFRVSSGSTTFAQAFRMVDEVMLAGVSCIAELFANTGGLLRFELADLKAVLSNMGTATFGSGIASGERRGLIAAEAAICNPLLADVSLKRSRGVLLSIVGGRGLSLYEVDDIASRVKQEIGDDTRIIIGARHDDALVDTVRVSLVASGLDNPDARGIANDNRPGKSLLEKFANLHRSGNEVKSVGYAVPVPKPFAVPATPLTEATRPDVQCRVFLNYRRTDTDAWADRVFERLVEQFTPPNVFMDIDAEIPIGLPWASWLDRKVAECDLMLVLIGRRWVDELRARAQLDEVDFVRVEIERALVRGIPVVPVLLGEAEMPLARDLPASIGPLLSLQATRLRRGTFAVDVERLIAEVRRSVRIANGF